jgi:sugar/nucleoside kinase (ribokinase family)
VHDLAARAKARGALLSFDPNYRPALWESPAEALAAHAALLPLVDWYLCGADEGRLLFGDETPSEVLASIVDRGAAEAVVRVGAAGALTEAGLVPPPKIVPVRDEIGAGDGFAAGVAWGRLQGWRMERAVQAGHCVAASVLHATSDWETYPTADELLAALSA